MLTVLSSSSEGARIDPRDLPRAAAIGGLYVHVPFCFHKCHYCDFYSITRQSAERMRRYVDLVLSEARSWVDRPPKIAAKTVFFGGGTPSLLPLEEMRRLIGGLREIFDCSAVKKRLGTIRGVEDDIELEMLHHTRRGLNEAGFFPYEISNYAKRGEECRHNLLYWNGGNYLGLGPAAASHVEGHRWKNRPHLGEWEKAIREDHLPATDVEHLTSHQRASELIMLQLRLCGGVDLKAVEKLSG